MDTIQIVTSSVASVSLLFLSVLWWFSWRSKAYVMDKLIRLNNRIEERATPTRLAECESLVKSFSSRIDTAAIDNEAFRGAVHKSLQRFDQIMRRNEQALIQRAERVGEPKDDSEYPEEIQVGEHQPPQAATKRLTRPELRELARKAGK